MAGHYACLANIRSPYSCGMADSITYAAVRLLLFFALSATASCATEAMPVDEEDTPLRETASSDTGVPTSRASVEGSRPTSTTSTTSAFSTTSTTATPPSAVDTSRGSTTPSNPACHSPSERPERVGDSILVLGDSLTVSVESQLRDRLPGVEVLALGARTIATPLRTDSGIDTFNNAPPDVRQRPIRVIALGTNDLWGLQLSRRQLVNDSRKLLTALHQPPLSGGATVWILPAMAPPIDDRTREELAWFIEFLKEESGKWDCLFTADWSAQAFNRRDEYLQADGVHLTDSGEDAFVQLITSAVSEILGDIKA